MVNNVDQGAHRFVEIRHSSGLRAKVLTYGATLTELWVPDAAGEFADIILGHDWLEDWLASDFYAGAICGRYANRIGGAAFWLEGRLIELVANEGQNQLHGGPQGFARRLWQITASGEDFVTLALTSPDGDMGFPEELRAEVTYRFDAQGRFWIEIGAEASGPTVVNMTNHAYFNLAGQGAGVILNHNLQIAADHFTPVGEGLIPTGEIRSVEGTVLDFRQMRRIGEAMHSEKGVDHNLCLSAPLDLDWGAALRPCAKAVDPLSGRAMEIRTNQNGVQFYSGGYLHGRWAGKKGAVIGPFAGFALETQAFPDSPNQPQFPSTRLDRGQRYQNITAFAFTPQAPADPR